jgi:hypothetical protein
MKKLFLVFLLSFLVSCSGPVFVAKTEVEGIRGSYQDPKLSELSTLNQETLKDIYRRYQTANIDIYPNGIGFSTLFSDDGRKYYYLLVDVRPRDITFGMGQTTPDKRFSEVYNNHLENNLRYINKRDLEKTGVDGLAFAVHWPVRDLSQCDSHGGFLEYVIIYLPKADFASYTEGERTFAETIRKGEVYRSLNGKKAEAVMVIQEES